MKQYRPSLSLPQIKHILDTYVSLPSTPEIDEIRSKLSSFYLKASVGAVTASHSSTDILESLGLSDSEDPGKIPYEKFRNYGASVCSASEIELALEYGYLNDLLSPEEEKQYEESQGVGSAISS